MISNRKAHTDNNTNTNVCTQGNKIKSSPIDNTQFVLQKHNTMKISNTDKNASTTTGR